MLKTVIYRGLSGIAVDELFLQIHLYWGRSRVIQTVALTYFPSPLKYSSLFMFVTIAYKDFAGFGEGSTVSTELLRRDYRQDGFQTVHNGVLVC